MEIRANLNIGSFKGPGRAVPYRIVAVASTGMVYFQPADEADREKFPAFNMAIKDLVQMGRAYSV